MQRPEHGRGLFYTRDSGGKHEMTPAQYVGWARTKAAELGIKFTGTAEMISAMIRAGSSRDGDIFLDYDVSGNLLSRPGLDALMAAATDPAVSHLFIPRRDRFARPDDPIDALVLENGLRRSGITMVFMDRICPPIAKGQRLGIEDILVGVIDYDRAGKDRRELAEKIIFAQLGLVNAGFSTGGRPPYGFRRWLVREDGTPVRQLELGERVRMRGHHVIWLPGPEAELAVIRRILKLLRTMPASRVGKLLTDEGVPSPDAGRMRKDNGIRHYTSGAWTPTTIINIARNPLLLAMCSYGRRSMGDQLRFTAEGPRPLTDTDFRPNGKPKVIRNPDEAVSLMPARFDPVADPDDHKELIAVLNARAGSQRGKPRSRDPNKNPLGSRVFDIACGWPMYRVPYNESFRYTCGEYLQTRQCEHNHVDGPTATRFTLSLLRQKLISLGMLAMFKQRMTEMAAMERPTTVSKAHDLTSKSTALERVKDDLGRAQRNMARAQNDEQYQAVAREFEDLRRQQAELEQDLQKASVEDAKYDVDAEVGIAMQAFNRLPDLVADEDNLAMIGEAFRLVNVRLFLGFRPEPVGKRTLNKLTRGVVTFGEAPPPVALYGGPTGRRAIGGKQAATVAAARQGEDAHAERGVAGREEKSLRNVSRGDKI